MSTDDIDPDGSLPTTVRVPRHYTRALRRLYHHVLRQGVDHLPARLKEVLTSSTCPLCGKEMRKRDGYLVCKCGMAKPRSADALSISNLVGYGAIAFAMLAREDKPTRKTSSASKDSPEVNPRREKDPGGTG